MTGGVLGERRINLCFHGVGRPARELEPGEDGYWISERLLADVLDVAGGCSNVDLSFDDGNASDVEIGLPALAERGLRATFFPLAARLDQPGSLSTADLVALVDAGMEVGSHGMWHKPWRGMTDAQLDEELVTARDEIAAASGRPVTCAACPLGRYDRRVLGRLRGLGYARAFTSDRSATRASWWLQPRFTVRRADDLETVREIVTGRVDPVATLVTRAKMAVKRRR